MSGQGLPEGLNGEPPAGFWDKSVDGIRFSFCVPEPSQTRAFYDAMGWSEVIGRTEEELHGAMRGSWRVLCAFAGGGLVGMGRIVSDGHLNAYLCGLGVLPEYRGRGIGAELAARLLRACRASGLSPQLLCGERLAAYYRELGFEVFAVGMKA